MNTAEEHLHLEQGFNIERRKNDRNNITGEQYKNS